MATEPTLAIDDLLAPISPGEPSGRDLRYEPAYGEIAEARRSEDDSPQGDWQRKTKVSEWDKVLKIGAECLARKTKDLQIAAWMVEGLGHRHQFAGLRDGFRLMNRLQEIFWDTYYPQVEDDDLETRHRPFNFLNTDRVLPFLIRSIPLTLGSQDQDYSLSRHVESRNTTNVGLKDPDQMEALRSEGKIDAEMFDDAVAQTPKAFYVRLDADLDEAVAAFREFEAATDARFGNDAPSLVNVRKAMDECRRLVSQILAKKREAEPDAVPEVVEEETDQETLDESPPEPEPDDAPVAVVRKPRSKVASGPIGSVEEARDRILEAAQYLREQEPGDPAAFLVVRGLRMGSLYALPRPLDPNELACPSSEARQSLRRKLADGDWAEVLRDSESALARPEGTAWLDPHRAAIKALDASADTPAAATACRAFLRAILADFPELERSALADDTPAASEATRSWLGEEFAPPPVEPPPQPEPEEYEPPPAPRQPFDGTEGLEPEPDAWDLAMDEVRAGRVGDGLQRLRREVARATTGREKFRRKLQMAELCLMVRNTRVASPLLEELARQVDAFRLEEWEEEGWCARVWGGLYRCLCAQAGGGASDPRLQEVYTRLCRLDIEAAMALGDEAGPP